MAHGKERAPLDAGRAVADHPVEIGAQRIDHMGDAVLGERVLVAGLRGREEVERLQPLVPDQRLRQFGLALDDVDEVEDDAALGPEDEVEIAQAHVEIDDRDPVAGRRQRRTDRGGRRGLADAAFAGGDYQNRPHDVLQAPWCQSKISVTIASPRSRTRTGLPASCAGLSATVW